MNASQANIATGVTRATVGRWIKAGKLAADVDGYFEKADFDILNAERLKKPGPGRATSAPQPAKKKAKKKKTVAKKKAAKKKSKKKATAKKTPPVKPEKPSEDELLIQAREHCKKVGNYSIATVQRKFQIGYNRAQRIITTIKREQAESQEDEDGQPNEAELRIAKNARSRQGVDLRKALANAEKAEMEVKIKMKDLISRALASRVFRKIYTIDSTEWRGLGPRIAPDIMAACKIEDPTKEVEISDLVERQVFRTLDHVKRVINEFLEEVESEDRASDEPVKKMVKKKKSVVPPKKKAPTKKKSKKKAAKKAASDEQ